MQIYINLFKRQNLGEPNLLILQIGISPMQGVVSWLQRQSIQDVCIIRINPELCGF